MSHALGILKMNASNSFMHDSLSVDTKCRHHGINMNIMTVTLDLEH
jgi:hypothetical protein